MYAGFGLDELCSDADAVGRPAHRAFERVAHPEFTPDLLHIDAVAFVGKARITSDHKEPADP